MLPYLALLRGINVGGNMILPMAELRTICESLGFAKVRTYIQSGNVLFESALSEDEVVKVLEKALHTRMGKPVSVKIRPASELGSVLSRNPFPQANPSRVGVVFLSGKAPSGLLQDMEINGPEAVVPSEREVFIHYPDGMGRTK